MGSYRYIVNVAYSNPRPTIASIALLALLRMQQHTNHAGIDSELDASFRSSGQCTNGHSRLRRSFCASANRVAIGLGWAAHPRSRAWRFGAWRLAGATDKVALLGWGLLAGRFGQNPVDAREQVLRALNRVLARPYLLDQLVTLSTEFVQMFVRPFDLVVH